MKKIDGLLKIVLMVVFGSCCLWAGPNNRHFKNAAGKYGLIDDNFRVILPAEYLYAGELSEGAINVKLASNEWALIDENRKELCRVKALRLGKVINGWARVETEDYGYILRSKGMVPAEDGTWIYFDLVDREYELRTGEPDVTGKLVVIGTDIDEHKLDELFGIE